MTAQLGVVVIVEAFDGRFLDRAVPLPGRRLPANAERRAFDLAIRPRMLDLGQPMFDAVFFTAHVEHMGDPCRRGTVGVTRREGELDSIVGEDRVDLVRNGLDQRDEEGRGGGSRRFRLQPNEGEFACPINANSEVEFAFRCLNFGNVDVEKADRIGLELLLRDDVARDLWQARDVMALQAAV